MSTSYETALQEFSMVLGERTASQATTTTSAGTTSTAISTALMAYGDGFFQDWWIRITSGTNSGLVCQITAYDGDTGTCTFTPVVTAAVDSGVTFQLHKFHPTRKIEALNMARLSIGAKGVLGATWDQSIVTVPGVLTYAWPADFLSAPRQVLIERPLYTSEVQGNLITNGGFETYSSGFTGWSATAGTVAEETYPTSGFSQYIREGQRALRMLVTASSTHTYLQTITNTSNYYAGRSITYWVDVFCLTADRLRVTIADSIGTSNSPYHRGGGWETLEITRTIPVSASTISVGLRVDSGTSFQYYADNGAAISASERPSNTWNAVHLVNLDSVDRTFTIAQGAYAANRFLRLQGEVTYGALSATTDTIELDAPRTLIWYHQAAIELYEMEQAEVGGMGGGRSYEPIINLHRRKLSELQGRRTFRNSFGPRELRSNKY